MNKINKELQDFQRAAAERSITDLTDALRESEGIRESEGVGMAYGNLRGAVNATLSILGIYLTDEGADAFRPNGRG